MKRREEKDGEQLKVRTVDFTFSDRWYVEDVTVRFVYDADGKPMAVSFFWGNRDDVAFVQDNCDGRWKACHKHAKKLIDLVTKPAKVAKRVAKRSPGKKPQLRIYG